jgi:crotonobetainyl-CoA:carnitine CoA-transferase CaiB-like acyl-CoA transferase
MFDDPQVQHLKMAAPLEHPQLGAIALVAQPVDMSRTPSQVTVPAPEPGAHSEEILREIGFSAEELAKLRERNVV